MENKKFTAKKFYHLNGGQEDGTWYLGRVRIFIVNEFTYHKELNIDYDETRDIEAIKTTFTKFHFKVDDAILNPTRDELIRHLKEEIDYFGCIILFIFSHGEENGFYASDYNKTTQTGIINATKDVYDQFSGDKWGMQHCPKVFFNEWCQIAKNEPKKYHMEKYDTLKIDELEESLSRESLSDSDSDDSSEYTYEISCGYTAHRLIYNAAQATHHIAVGSYSTQTFCRILNELGQKKDLEYILKLVMEEVGKMECGMHDYPQPSISSTLPGKLYLLPAGKVYELKSNFRKKFNNIKFLGKGNFGVVFEAEKIVDNKKYAIKRIQLEENLEKTKKEFMSLAKLQGSTQIVRYYDAWDEPAEFNSQLIKNNESNIIHFCYIQMELCGETLEQWLKEKSQFEKVESLKIFKQIIKGLEYLHDNDVVHRDVKPSNILFAINNKDIHRRVRIADFGLVKNVDSTSNSTVIVGTSTYMAPECHQRIVDTKSDMYSAGLILIELLYKCSEENRNEIFYDATCNKFPQSILNDMDFVVPTLKKLLSRDLNKRPSSKDLLKTIRGDPTWEQVEFESTCELAEHLRYQVYRWSTVDTLEWNLKNVSAYFPLSTLIATNTRWKVQFLLWPNSDFAVRVKCMSLDARYHAATVQLLAVVDGHAQVWMQVAAILKSGEESSSSGRFSKKISELTEMRPLKVHLHMQWTELDQLPSTNNRWDEDVYIYCRWKLNAWRTVCPTSDDWRLFSQAVGQRGVFWRIFVGNKRLNGERKLVVGVQLQHLMGTVNWSRLLWNCSMSLWDHQFDVEKLEMAQSLCCSWEVIDLKSNIESELVLFVAIKVSRNN